MKKLIIAVSVIFLSACTTERVVIERVQETTTTVQTNESSQDEYFEDQYLQGVTGDFPSEIARLGKVKAIQLGYYVCQAIDEGTTIQELVDITMESSVDPGFIGSVIREAVHNFCPNNQWFIDSALNA